MLGPILFALYTQPISRIVHQCSSDLHKLSDDIQLFSSALSSDFATLSKQAEQYVSEAMVVSIRSRTGVSCNEHLETGGSLFPFQPKVKNLGVVLDANLIRSDHISSVCCSAYLKLLRISAICPFLTSATATLVCSCQSSDWLLQFPLGRYNLDQLARLQRMQNKSAQLIFHKKHSM